MKRKITNLEQKLIDENWKLVCKHYKGKHSQFVESYEYCLEDYENGEKYIYTCFLNKKRNACIGWNVSFPYSYELSVDLAKMEKIEHKVRELENYLKDIGVL